MSIRIPQEIFTKLLVIFFLLGASDRIKNKDIQNKLRMIFSKDKMRKRGLSKWFAHVKMRCVYAPIRSGER